MSMEAGAKNEFAFAKTSGGGAYEYIVVIAVTVIAVNSALPMAAFGIVFGQFLSTLGDETTTTSLANGILNTVLSFTGLATNVLLNKFSCRNVGLIGGIVISIGCFSLVFVQDLTLFVVFYGVFQGFGYGLLLPASLTALTHFFDKKLCFIQSLSQALMVACTMSVPPITTLLMSIYGYRKTLLWIGGLSLLNIPSSVVLSRMKWTRKTKKAETKSINYDADHIGDDYISVKCKSNEELGTICTNTEKPLLKKHSSLKDVASDDQKDFRILHMADRTASSLLRQKYEEKDNRAIWKTIFTSIDYSLLANLKYLNISLGLSLSYSSDISFISIIPLMLLDVGFSNSHVALAMSIFFGCDLLSRIVLSVVTAVHNPRSRDLVLWGSFISAIFRIGFVLHHLFLWKTITLGALGFLRCFIQTPLPLVISEEYHNQFATAYSLYMVVCGVITLALGLLISAIKSLTNSDVMVCHLLTCCYLMCVISWISEKIIGSRKTLRMTKEEQINS